MKLKRLLSCLLALILTLGITSSVIAVPYQNYTATESGYYPEPQAYVPTAVYSALTIGLDQLNGIALNNPQDLLRHKATGNMLIADTGNNRIIVLDHSFKVVKQIITTFTYEDKVQTFNNPQGLFISEVAQELYVCDTDNARIVRFAYGDKGFVVDRIFNDPDISKFLTDQATPAPDATATPDTGELPTAAPAATPTPAPATATPATVTTLAPGATAVPTATAAVGATTVPNATSAPSGGTTAGSIKYAPIKLVVDDSMRMYVVSKGNYLGLIELTKDGDFSKFMGATRVAQSLTAVWKRILSASQKSSLAQNLSTEYSNVTMDKDGFIFGTISNITGSDIASHFSSKSQVGAPVRKLNASGFDVLLRQGFLPPAGDKGSSNVRDTYSFLVDVCVSDIGIYSVLDQTKGRVFTYDSTGDLLYVFGAIGEVGTSTVKTSKDDQVGFTQGTALSPVAIELLDDQTIAVLDSKGAQVTVYEPTEYGLLLRSAIQYHESRQYDKAVDAWNKVLQQSSNSSLAYTGIGRVFFINGQYKQAVEYFKKGFNQVEYGQAFNKYRNEVMAVVIPYLLSALIVFIVLLLIYSWQKKFRSFIKRGGKRDD